MLKAITLCLVFLCGGAQATTPSAAILTVYTTDAVSYLAAHNITDLTAFTNYQVGTINTAFTSSGVDAVVTSVGYITVPAAGMYTANTKDTLLEAFFDYTVLHARDVMNADAIMIVVNTDGIGLDSNDDLSVYLGSALEVGVPETQPGWAIAAVEVASIPAGVAEGNNPSWSYAHEFGHLLGMRHQMTGGALNNDTTITPYRYAHGYPFVTHDHCYHTIMSYDVVLWNGVAGIFGCPSSLFSTQIHLLRWSNPAQFGYDSTNTQYFFGATSYWNANEVMYLHDAVAIMSNFHSTKVAAVIAAKHLLIDGIVLFP